MTEKEFIPLTVGILKEILADVPDDYTVRFEDHGMSFPVMNYEVQDNLHELSLKFGDLNEEI